MKHFCPKEKKRFVKAELPCVAASMAKSEFKCSQKNCKTNMTFQVYARKIETDLSVQIKELTNAANALQYP